MYVYKYMYIIFCFLSFDERLNIELYVKLNKEINNVYVISNLYLVFLIKVYVFFKF